MKVSNFVICFLISSFHVVLAQDEDRSFFLEPRVFNGVMLGKGGGYNLFNSDIPDGNGSNYTNKGGNFFGVGLTNIYQIKKWNAKLDFSISQQTYQQLLIIPHLKEQMYHTLESTTHYVMMQLGIGRRVVLNENSVLNFDIYYGGHYKFGHENEKTFESSVATVYPVTDVVLNWHTESLFWRNLSFDLGLETTLGKNALLFHVFWMDFRNPTPVRYTAKAAIPGHPFAESIQLGGYMAYVPMLFGVGIGFKI
jgi:hypothetical protein